jgi:hypothetical protein
MLSLPAAMEITLETIPGKVPYLYADPARSNVWRSRVDRAARGKMRVGVVWAGSPGYVNDARRSIALDLLAPLAEVGGVTLFSLQKGRGADAGRPPSDLPLVDFTVSLTDFAETAALVEQLDLVISVDTAVAHVAGAMAKPVWTLLPFDPDWRWMLYRSDTPWYPTMRLFRQRAPDDWKGAIEEVRQALTARVEAARRDGQLPGF